MGYFPFGAAVNTAWQPSDNGLLAATATLDGGAIVATPTAGTIYLQKLLIRSYPLLITNIWYIVTTVGVGTSTGSFVGVYNSAGSLLSGSADIGANLLATGNYSTPLTTPQTITSGFVWIAVVTNLATTQPGLRAEATTSFATVDLGLTVATARSASNVTGQTSLPASITPGSNVFSSTAVWFGTS